MTTTTAIIPGTPVALLDGKEYTVPPLTWSQAYALVPQVRLVLGPLISSSEESLVAALEIAGTALRRNYPEMTSEHLSTLLDIRSCLAVLLAAIYPQITAAPPTFLTPPPGALPN